MSLGIEDVKKIAALARIGIEEKEVESYQKDISAILDYFKTLEELDTNSVEPISHITGMENVVREDIESDFGELGKEVILRNAPAEKNGFVRVKSVF